MKSSLVRALAVAAVACAALSAAAPRARAQVVHVSNLTSTRDDFWDVGDGPPGAGAGYTPFQLTGTASIARATLRLGIGSSQPASDFTVSLLSDDAGTPGTTVFGSATGTGTGFGFSSYQPFDFDFASAVDLAPGSYWLKLIRTGGTIDLNWGSTNTVVNTGVSGTSSLGLYYDETTLFGDQAFLFSLSGPATAAIPEPGSLATGGVLSTLALVASLRRARRRRVG